MKSALEVYFFSIFYFHYNMLVAKSLCQTDLSESDYKSHVKCLLKLELVNDSTIMNNVLV